jgi:hypothetical protein
MDVLTADELLADAISCVVLNVLDRLANDLDAKRAFLESFLGLVDTLDIGLPTEFARTPVN